MIPKKYPAENDPNLAQVMHYVRNYSHYRRRGVPASWEETLLREVDRLRTVLDVIIAECDEEKTRGHPKDAQHAANLAKVARRAAD